MGYFRELPNLSYPSFLSDKNSSLDYLEVKNLFRRVKLRDDLQSVFTMFNKYQIPEGARPDTVAEDLYGSSQLDWVVLLTAGIINVRNEWPISNKELYNYALNKYGDSLNSPRFYETTEVKDSNDRLILPKGKVVDSNFTIPKPGAPEVNLNPVVGINNYEYEVRLNDAKRNIYVLRQGYLQEFLNDMRELMTYKKSSEYVNGKLIKVDNLYVKLP
jgi:hypothetical protein